MGGRREKPKILRKLTKMNETDKNWIDKASYVELLQKWRFAAIGDLMFQGETGNYYARVMEQKKLALCHDQQVLASKFVGWGK